MKNLIREPNVSGSFYSADAQTLKNQLQSFLTKTPDPLSSSLQSIGFIAPHAGYQYSGQTAAYVYKLIEAIQPENIIILGPSHFTYFDGMSIDNSSHYKTPLGDIEINKDLATEIGSQTNHFKFMPAAHQKEHSLETQIPFIQVASPSSKIIPIVIGNVSDKEITATAHVLEEIIRKNQRTVLIASSDMSHFHNHHIASEMDKKALANIVQFDVQTLIQDYLTKKIEMCGFIPALITMLVMENMGYNNTIMLNYSDSGDVTGDKASVVGYSAVCFARIPYSQDKLSQEEKKYLLRLARHTIRGKLDVAQESLPEIESDLLKQKRGAFVTLHKQGRLRGCIGYIQPVKSIRDTIREMAISAAFHDPRFAPLGAEEEPEIDIEISVLSPIQEVTDVNDIEVGTHGLVMKQGNASGLLLPQVPVEWNWNRLEFLQQTCLKAGLAPDAWQKGAQIFSFTADIFNESLLH